MITRMAPAMNPILRLVGPVAIEKPIFLEEVPEPYLTVSLTIEGGEPHMKKTGRDWSVWTRIPRSMVRFFFRPL
jgi:hypothetical protein